MRKLLAVIGLLLGLAPVHAQIMGLPPSSSVPGGRLEGTSAAAQQWYKRVRPTLQAMNSSFVGATYGKIGAGVSPTSRALTAGWRNGVDQLITGDVNSGYWFNLDHEYVFAAPSQVLALTDLVSGTGPAQPSAQGASIAFDAFGGYSSGSAGSAGSAYVDTGVNLATGIAGGSHYQTATGGFGFCLIGNVYTNGSLALFPGAPNTMGVSNNGGSQYLYITIGYSATQSFISINSSTSGNALSSNALTAGSFAAYRTSAGSGANQVYYVNGATAPLANSVADAVPYSEDLALLATNGTGGSHGSPVEFNDFAEWDVGAVPTAGQVATKRTLLQTLMNDINQLDAC